jgi:hypothetical protein
LGSTIVKTCEHCEKEFTVQFSKRKKRFCSKSCSNTGENNGMYGRTDLSVWTGKPAWNAGLTAKSDERLAALGQKISKQMKEKFKSGKLSNKGKNNPNFGRTRDTRTKEQLDNYSKAAISRLQSGNVHPYKFATKGYFYSKKIGRKVYYRSSYEKRALVCFELDDEVIGLDYENIVIRYDFNNEPHRYLVDFDVLKESGRELVEVKGAHLLNHAITLEKTKAGINYCNKHNIKYSIYTLEEIKEYEKKLGINSEK